MRRTTVNVVTALQALGVKSYYENTGGGIMCGVIELPNGRRVYFNDNVPDAVYELARPSVALEIYQSAWRDYEGGFDLVDVDGESIFCGTIGGSRNLGVGFATAKDMAEEYVKICKALDPDFAPAPPRLPTDMQDALSRFLSAGYALNEVWNRHLNNRELEWLAGPDRYPHYLPAFDEFLLEFGAKLQGET